MSGSESALRQFLNEDGANWERVTAVVAGILSASFFGSIADTISALFDTLLIKPLEGAATFVETIIWILFAVPRLGLEESWHQATLFVQDLGLFGYVGAILVVGAVVLIAYQWRRFT